MKHYAVFQVGMILTSLGMYIVAPGLDIGDIASTLISAAGGLVIAVAAAYWVSR